MTRRIIMMRKRRGVVPLLQPILSALTAMVRTRFEEDDADDEEDHDDEEEKDDEEDQDDEEEDDNEGEVEHGGGR